MTLLVVGGIDFVVIELDEKAFAPAPHVVELPQSIASAIDCR